VLGSNFLDVDIGLPVKALAEPMRQCLSDSSQPHDVVLDAHDRKGRSFRCHVRTRALRKSDQEIRGVILVMEPDSLS
jgi:two-component system CheB/CheR fusion protein